MGLLRPDDTQRVGWRQTQGGMSQGDKIYTRLIRQKGQSSQGCAPAGRKTSPRDHEGQVISQLLKDRQSLQLVPAASKTWPCDVAATYDVLSSTIL